MPILFRYLLQLFVQGFLKVLGIFVALFFMLDGAEQIRRFGGQDHVQWQDLVELIALRMPLFFVQFLPAIALLTTLFVVTRLTRLNELTVIRAGGVSLMRILIPFILGGMIVSGTQVILLDQVVPRTNALAKQMERHFSSPQNDSRQGELTSKAQELRNNLWIRDRGRILHARQAYSGEGLLLDVTLFQFTPGHDLTERLDARKAVRQGDQWILHDGQRHTFNPKETQSTPFKEHAIRMHLNDEQLIRVTPQPSELSLQALWQHANRLVREGYDATPYWVTLYRKMADPITTLAAILLAFPFALRLHRMGGTFRSMIAGFVTGFVMFVVVDLFTALGLGERLPPLLSAAAPVLFFISIGIFLLLHLEEDVPI
uniref:Putative Permease YjgP/YjgQ family protein n=1 Tax=Magnetococcus massalia (strain MO-1) TaxID=451514 RepID=A0A1S7LKG0_MAGMO|nr:putative Permease YjgP/YjgQ family protein [Candidatus Magnetococcus massalia]